MYIHIIIYYYDCAGNSDSAIDECLGYRILSSALTMTQQDRPDCSRQWRQLHRKFTVPGAIPQSTHLASDQTSHHRHGISRDVIELGDESNR